MKTNHSQKDLKGCRLWLLWQLRFCPKIPFFIIERWPYYCSIYAVQHFRGASPFRLCTSCFLHHQVVDNDVNVLSDGTISYGSNFVIFPHQTFFNLTFKGVSLPRTSRVLLPVLRFLQFFPMGLWTSSPFKKRSGWVGFAVLPFLNSNLYKNPPLGLRGLV